jgi:DNA-binding NtrC family response regulator
VLSHTGRGAGGGTKGKAVATTAKTLVIDDEPRVVTALARLLQRDGSVVATARNGRHALAVLQLRVRCLASFVAR